MKSPIDLQTPQSYERAYNRARNLRAARYWRELKRIQRIREKTATRQLRKARILL